MSDSLATTADPARAGRTADAFLEAFGHRPEGVWSAPGRVNLIGEHTDYNAGLALPIALPHRTYAAASPRTDGLLRVWSHQAGGPVEVDLAEVGPGVPGGWAAYAVGVPWALARALPRAGDRVAAGTSGLDLLVDSDVPLGAGLSSSAALGCSVGAAVADLWGLDLLGDEDGRQVLVAAAREAENVVAGAPTGGMDQSASMRCRAGHALLLDCRDGHVEHVPFDLGAAGLVLLVVDTRAEHALVDGQYAARRASCERAAATLGVAALRALDPHSLPTALGRLDSDEERRRVRHVVTEIDRVRATVTALDHEDFEEVGRLFVASHASLRDDYEVSCAELDVTVDTCLTAGALGARMTGGGFGGSAIALVPTAAAEAVTEAVHTAYTARGWRPPVTFTCVASGPAGRDL